MPDRLSLAIAACDGHDLAPLQAVVAGFTPSADDLAGLVVLVQVGDASAQVAASWLLAHFLDRGLPLPPDERLALLRCLDQDRPWQVKRHLCGAVRWLQTPPEAAFAACASLERLASDPHRTVRAAALDGLAALATPYPQLAERIDRVLLAASDDEAPSVRAKARVLRRSRPAAPEPTA